MNTSWFDEALKGAEWHEKQREKCANIGSIATSRAAAHSRMYHGILYAHNLAFELLEKEKKLLNKIKILNNTIEELNAKIGT